VEERAPQVYNACYTLTVGGPNAPLRVLLPCLQENILEILALADHEEGRVTCPHCGSHKVEQRWSAFSVITSRKSA